MEVDNFLFAAPKVNRVAFGSCTERRLFPVHTTPTRFGIEQGLRGEPHRGPGCYDPDPVSISTRCTEQHLVGMRSRSLYAVHSMLRGYSYVSLCGLQYINHLVAHCQCTGITVPSATTKPTAEQTRMVLWCHTSRQTAQDEKSKLITSVRVAVGVNDE